MQDFLIPFFTLLAAEMLDKSQLAILLLSSRYKNHLQLFLGIVLAFTALSALAIITGTFLTEIIPPNIIKVASGILFILFGIFSFRSSQDTKNVKPSNKNAFLAGFSMLFLAELGDKTQLATAVFATQYNPWLVFIAAVLALSILGLVAMILGGWLTRKIDKNLLNKIAGVIFILLGVAFLLF